MSFRILNIAVTILVLTAGLLAESKSALSIYPKMILMPGGYYLPLFKDGGGPNKEFVKTFLMDQRPITNAEYLEFVKANPEWRKSKVKRIFADENYLRKWKSDLEPGREINLNDAVTNVSWFAANAYCGWIGKRLPTVSEWEFALKKNESMFSHLNSESFYEWTFNFNDTNLEMQSACGGAGSSANDPRNYSAFLRYGFRNGLKANYSLDNLGFRCVNDKCSAK